MITTALFRHARKRLGRCATPLVVLGALLAVGAAPATADTTQHKPATSSAVVTKPALPIKGNAAASATHPVPVIVAPHSPKPAPRPVVKTGYVPKPTSHARTAQPALAWSLTFNAHPAYALVGNSATLTAVANQDVGPTPYWIQIYDYTGRRLAACGSGTVCTATDSSSTPTSRGYLAVVSLYAATWSSFYDPTGNGAQAAQYVDVSWRTAAVSLYSDYTTLPTGNAVTLEADASFDVGPTSYYIEIFDNNTGTRIALCGGGTTCSVSVTYNQPDAHRYVAFISSYSASYPPAGILAASVTSEPWVTWTTSNLRVSLDAALGDYTAPYSVTATANADVGPTPYYIEIFSETRDPATGIDTGSSLLATCAFGTTCTIDNIPAYTPVTAFISPYATTMPPGTIANSGTVYSARTLIP